MKAAVEGGAEIVVCAGFMQASALERIAKEAPEVKFVFVDGWNMGLENVTAIIFQDKGITIFIVFKLFFKFFI